MLIKDKILPPPITENVSKKERRNVALQSIKGISCIVVFMGHASGMMYSSVLESLKSTPLSILFDGQCAVVIFFFVTGFFLYKNAKFKLTTYKIAVIKKAVRIYPLYILVTIVGFNLCNCQMSYPHQLFTEWGNSFWSRPVSLFELIRHLSLVLPFDSNLINPPIWYIVVEMRLAFILPLIVWAITKKGMVIALVLMVASFTIPNIGFLNCIGYYLSGYCLRWFVVHHGSYLSSLGKSQIWPAILLMSFCLLGIFHIIGIEEYKLPHSMHAIQSIGAMLLVAIVLACDFRLLHAKLLIRMGDISYSFYLLHFVVLLSFRPLGLPVAYYLPLCFLLTLLMSMLSFHYIEKPIVVYFRGLLR